MPLGFIYARSREDVRDATAMRRVVQAGTGYVSCMYDARGSNQVLEASLEEEEATNGMESPSGRSVGSAQGGMMGLLWFTVV